MPSQLRAPHAAFAAVLVAVCAAALHLQAGHPSVARASVVPALDPLRYSGTWFEVARVPNGARQRCVGDVTATYGVRPGGSFEVVDRCLRSDGTVDINRGEARPRQGDRTGARLEVNFLPRILRRLPLGWGDQWIVAVDPEYRVAVISDSDRTQLRVLSRVPELDPERLLPMMAALRAQGYAVDRLVRTPQPAAATPGPARVVNVTT
jgi:apolipoprotein D and lipocalin family protein